MSSQSKRPRLNFFLDRLDPDAIKKASEKYDGGNMSRSLNLAIEWYIACRKSGDKGLTKFLEERLED